MAKPKLAAQLYTVREFTQTAEGFAESIAKVSKIGYTAAQVSGIGPIPHAEVKAITDAHGITICNTHIPYNRLKNDMDDVIAQHHLWDCKHVAIGAMPKNYITEGIAGFQKFAAEASQIGKTLHEAGLTFSYHNHSFEFIRLGEGAEGRNGLEILFAESDPTYLLAELDVYWIQHGGGDPVDWTRRMKGRMPVIHLKDMSVSFEDKKVTQLMAEVGEGNLNWPGILEACEYAEVEWAAVEQDICQRDPFESLKISFENLVRMGLS